MDKLRLMFSKTGRAVYISHLDLMRTMQRAFLRAGYPLKYSEGFNPHAQISILLPLSVGCSSVCELMDFTLREDVPAGEIPARLTAVMPEGIEVTQAYPPERKAKELKWLKISGRFEYDSRPLSEMPGPLGEFFSRESLVITKKTKRGEGQSDIRPAIREITFSDGEDCVSLNAVISAQEPTLNPDLLVSALRQLNPGLAPDFAEFRREEVFDENMNIFR